MRALIAAGLVALAVAASADARTQTVSSEAGFQAAARELRATGGTIVLRRGQYGTLVIRARSGRWLTVRGKPGVTVRYLVIRHARRVRVERLRVRGGILNVHSSSSVVLDRVRVVRARMSLAGANGVTIRRSVFTRCGENREACLSTGWGQWASSHVRVLGSRFVDCFGCDFIRGSIGTGFVLRGSLLARAVPGAVRPVLALQPPGRHPDDRRAQHPHRGQPVRARLPRRRPALPERRHPGPDDPQQRLPGTDPAFPDFAGVAAITLGHHRTDEPAVPVRARIVNNTILTGTPRANGWASSVYLTPSYLNVPLELRPIVANNVIGLAAMPERLCALASVSSRNIVRDGVACSDADAVLDPMLSESGVPLDGSPVIDQADPAWSTGRDLRGRVRDDLPDIGAFEF